MKLKRARKSKKGRIEIIPMIDVMFFLLATFMLSSLAMQKISSLPVNLPQGQAQIADVSKKITITIDKNNLLYLNKSSIVVAQIKEKIYPLINSGFDDTIIINADKNSSHGIVTESMLQAKQAGAKHFSIVVEE